MPRPFPNAVAALAAFVLTAGFAQACPVPMPETPAPAPAPVPRTCEAPPPPVTIDAEEHRLVARTLREAIAEAIVRDATKGEKAWGKVVISNELGEELATIAGFSSHVRGPQRGTAWIDARNAAAHPDILMYRIRWFNGRWSKWFIPGINDRDWKDPTGRVWRYFTDHEHEYVVIDPRSPRTTRSAYIGLNP